MDFSKCLAFYKVTTNRIQNTFNNANLWKRRSVGCSVLVSCGCNKAPQTEWLITTEVYSLTVWRSGLKRGPLGRNRGVGRATGPLSEALGSKRPCVFLPLQHLGPTWLTQDHRPPQDPYHQHLCKTLLCAMS